LPLIQRVVEVLLVSLCSQHSRHTRDVEAELTGQPGMREAGGGGNTKAPPMAAKPEIT
jgi:hypothetical protein